MRIRSLVVLCIAACCVTGISTAQTCGIENKVPQQPGISLARDLVEIESVWNGYIAALRAGDKEAALMYVIPAERESVLETLDLMGPFIKEWISDMLQFQPIEITDEVAIYALCQKSEKYGYEVFPVYFVRHPDLGWVLHSF